MFFGFLGVFLCVCGGGGGGGVTVQFYRRSHLISSQLHYFLYMFQKRTTDILWLLTVGLQISTLAST